ncbi:uncharacterized protein LY89DRAFT_599601 [Mollisia scopiformis]|uniref:Heterokaryon incompatibility domain-containing protein n=1 Tax=Mollisia scopiformis TaxID=149040 RepID=A0A132B814_MOLSC|nr:uncharacterized protein LY89DRAFT_599601 [Mollisia scopiformis]KUJ08546.1 hypothetical protein LY89DRAFT_599601 [Mollisia scopiformis]
MRSIYAASRSTTVFLGEATAGSDALLQAIESSSPSILTATTKAAVVNSLVSNSGMRKHELIEQAFKILWRPYWVRIWIFQEIVVSPNPWIQCGNMKVPWDTFCQAIIALLAPEPKAIFGSGYGNEARQRLEDMYWERRAYRLSQGISEPLPRWDMSGGREFEGRMGLLDLLVGKRGLEASDGRDMVFAISGIARKPKKWEDLSITYEKSPARVYMDTVKYLLDHNKTYEVLSHAGQSQDPSRQHLSKIPSWAPDWRVRSEYKHKIVDRKPGTNLLRWIPPSPTSSSSKPQYAYLPSHSILACLGTTYSAIQSISPDTSSIKPSPGSTSPSPSLFPSKITNLISRSHPLVYKRRLARTSTEVWALVPFDAEVGDLIVVFRGGGVFVLRRKGKEEWKKGVGWREWMFGARREDVVEEIRMAIGAAGRGKVIEHCRFVGECFVDGLMHKFSHVDEAQGTNEVIFAMH